MRVSAKLAPTFDYPVLERFWRDADELGFRGVYDYDHFLGLSYTGDAVFEGWVSHTGDRPARRRVERRAAALPAADR